MPSDRSEIAPNWNRAQLRSSRMLPLSRYFKNNLQGIIGLWHEHQKDNPGLDEAIGKIVRQVGTIALVDGLKGNGKNENAGLKDRVKAIVGSIHLPGDVEVAPDSSIE